MTLKGLQMLRCLGCVVVIGGHLHPQRMVGFFVLDIFFLVSAFFMAMLITLPSKTQESFAKDRVARAIPLYWSLTIGVFLMAALTPSLVGATTVNYVNLFKSLFFIPYYKENGLVNPILAVGWTINFEIMFYVFCIVSFFFPIRWRIPFVMAGVMLLYAVASSVPDTNAFTHFYSFYYMFDFPAGMLLWMLYARFKDRIVMPRIPAMTLVLVPLAFMFWADWHFGITVSWLLIFTLPSLVLVWGALCYEPYIGDGPLVRLAMLIGDASLSVYLTHMFVVEAMRKVVPKLVPGFDPSQPLSLFACLVLCLALGLAVDRYYDKPGVKALRSWLKGSGAARQGMARP